MPDPLVLILTHAEDVHADAVQSCLRAAGVEIARMDTSGLGVDVPVTAWLRAGVVSGLLGETPLERVSCVWHRRPSEFSVVDATDRAELQAVVDRGLSVGRVRDSVGR